VIFGNDLNLTALPKEIVQCTALQVLPLEGNRIKNLTARIDTLPHLQRISLAKNDFETVPPILLNCKALRQVDLRYNQIHLPLASPVPEFFDLTGNPPLKPPTGSTSSSGRCQIQ
jgi:Leucine-rich repeat (LRR) protein